MTDKQKRFVSAYVLCQNGARAAREAGYPPKNAGVEAHRLLKNPKIQKAISETVNHPSSIRVSAKVLAKNELTVSRLLDELKHMAFLDTADFFENGRVKPIEEMSESARRAITGFKEGKFGTELRFDKKIEALTLLARHLGVLQEAPAMQQGLSINIHLNGPATIEPAIDVTPNPGPGRILPPDSDDSGQA